MFSPLVIWGLLHLTLGTVRVQESIQLLASLFVTILFFALSRSMGILVTDEGSQHFYLQSLLLLFSLQQASFSSKVLFCTELSMLGREGRRSLSCSNRVAAREFAPSNINPIANVLSCCLLSCNQLCFAFPKRLSRGLLIPPFDVYEAWLCREICYNISSANNCASLQPIRTEFTF